MNGLVVFMENRTRVHTRLRGNNLVTKYVFPEGHYVIPKKSSQKDNETWENVVKVVASGIIKMKLSNLACALRISFSIYLSIHIFLSKFSADDMRLPSLVIIPYIEWLHVSWECH